MPLTPPPPARVTPLNVDPSRVRGPGVRAVLYIEDDDGPIVGFHLGRILDVNLEQNTDWYDDLMFERAMDRLIYRGSSEMRLRVEAVVRAMTDGTT